jgi:hypothetical protein
LIILVDIVFGDKKMVECVECGKRLGFFEGYFHPTLGKKSMVCSPCFVKVEESVVRWREFIISNSFNQESSTSILSVDWSSLFNRIRRIRKRLTRTEEKKSYYPEQRKACSKMALVPPRIIAMVFSLVTDESLLVWKK